MSGRVVDLFSHAPAAGAEPAYAELHCLSDFSFQRGAASARELFERAAHCGYTALAITDECSLAGIVRAFEAARDTGLELIVGSEFVLDDGLKLVLLVESLPGYEALCRLITQGRRAALKGQYHLTRADLADGLPGTLALWIPQRGAAGEVTDAAQGAWLKALFGARLWLAVELHRDQDDALRLASLQALAAQLGIRAVAAGDVHMDIRRRRALQDTMTAIRHNCSIAEAGARLFRNGERHLRTRRALAEVYPHAMLDETLRIARRCGFRLQQLKYRYPSEVVAPGHTPASWLRALTEEGVRERWPGGEPALVRQQVEKELALVAELEYEAYFLTVADIVRFARSRDILCQGRGSAANSAVCYALGVTAVDPASSNLLIERFISKERNEPPDIDIDFEHERREEVIQYIYDKYGRDRAALAATVIRYRGKSAVRDVARALGLPPDQVQQLSDCFGWWNGQTPIDTRLADAGFDPGSALMKRVMGLTRELLDHPRHLSQHVGGFVISDAPLWTLVPVENAAMPDRTILQWDKDDLDTMRLLKVDCLALGMLTCIRKALDLLRAHRGRDLTTATIPQEDPATYAMIQRADTIGVFQIESRAQMTMLPRLKPKTFYDLVIEVAIVRPGPIQGGMVHPYLRRRQGKEAVDYPSEKLRKVFERTLGVPLFQEQVMQLVIEAAGYSPGDADQLRRSMAAWRDGGDIERHRLRIRDGMLANAYSQAFIDQIFEQIRGFGSYGFPESHAASFALLVYVSCWIKCHEPAAFACALLNAQPMGFYPPSQITQDARRHGIVLLPVDVATSDWDNTLVGGVPARGSAPGTQPDLRLGLREISGLAEDVGRRLVAVRAQRPFADIADLCARARLDERARGLLAEAGALASLSGHRHAARWAVAGIEQQRPLFDASSVEEGVDLPRPTAGEDLLADYRTLGLTLGAHPLQLLRTRLARERCLSSSELRTRRHGSPVRTAGLVTLRQRPSTASGTTFVTLEDEHGMVSVIVWPRLAERQRRQLLGSRLLAVNGRWEKVDGVEHLIAGNLQDLSGLLGGLRTGSRDFH